MGQGAQPTRQDTLSQLIHAAIKIEEHNSLHSYAAGIGDFFGALIGSAIEVDPTERNLTPKKDPSKSADEIFGKYHRVLTATGFELVQNPLKTLGLYLPPEIDVQEKAATPGIGIKTDKLAIELINGEACLEFLRGIPPNVWDRPAVEKVFQLIAHSLDTQLVHSYLITLTGEEPAHWPDLLATCEGAVSELSRIGAKSESALLGAHLERIWQGTLSEYLLAEQSNILEGPGFKPHSWHKDSTPERYRERWENALEILERIGENPAALALYTSTLGYFKRSAKEAAEELRESLQRDSIPDWYVTKNREMLRILKQIESRLEILPENEL